MERVDIGALEQRDVDGLAERLSVFVEPYRERMTRPAQREHLRVFVAGLVGGGERKSVEPIAVSQGASRKQLQHFVGASGWNHRPLIDLIQTQVAEELGDAEAVLVVDSSGFPKKGTESVGVARQWCGRLGKVENCQLGVFVAYAVRGSCALVDVRLHLPRDWAQDKARRAKCHVPPQVRFNKPWEQADEMLRRIGPRMPHRWVTGDSEFGRVTALRDRLAKRGEKYMLEVPSSIVVRKVNGKAGRRPGWHQIPAFVKSRPITDWQLLNVRAGQKEPIEVIALAVRVRTRRRGRTKEETLLAIEAMATKERWFFLSNTPRHTPIAELVRAATSRHLIEEAFENAKGEVGLDHHEVRAWQGWHHHMTASLMALWFLVREHRRLGKKSTDLRGHGAIPGGRTPAPPAVPARNPCPLPTSARTQRAGTNRPLVSTRPGSPTLVALA
jgi:SRSO17 transposase